MSKIILRRLLVRKDAAVSCGLLLAPVLVLVFGLLNPTEAAAECRQSLRVGVTVALTGALSDIGTGFRDALLLADSLYDREGCVEYFIEDDQLKPAATVTAVRSLLAAQKVNAFITFGTPTSLAAAPIVEHQGIPTVAVTVLKRVTEQQRFVLRHFVSTEVLASRIAQEVARRGYKRVGVVTTMNEANLSLREAFLGSGVAQVVFDQTYAHEDTDFATSITKLLSAKPDAVYMLLFAPQSSIFMKRLRGMGYQGPVFAAHNAEDYQQVAAAEGAMEGVWFVSGADNRGEDFYRRFEARFGRLPRFGSASAFDLGKLFAGAAQQADKPLNEYFHTVSDFKGAFGTYSVGKDADFQLPVTVKLVAGGAIQEVPGR
jgi:ABC-type branched-subunit amino acid transport system substrate-binding protein